MRTIIAALIFVFAASAPTSAQTPDVQEQIQRLETQLRAIQAEIDKIKKANPTPVTTAVPESKPAPAAVAEKKQEPEKKPFGFELGNGVRAVPYGTIYFNLFGNDTGTNNTDIPLFATAGRGNISASVRQTRFGVRVEGLKIHNAKVSGVVEADFFGGSPAISIGENFGVVRVRLANAKIDWKDTSVTIGQDWMVFAPQNPVSIADAAIPQFAAAGNNWARLPQVKIEQRFDKGRVVWQVAVLEPQTGDSTSTASFLQQPNTGALSRIPFLQTRLAFADKDWFGTKKPGTVGVSGHFGRSRAAATTAPLVDYDIDSYGVALDWNFPLHKRLSWSGEAFLGQNLGGFQAGIFQNYNSDFAVRNGTLITPMGVRGIRTYGGWTQVGFTPDWNNDKLTFYGSVGLDDPRNRDLVNTRNRDFRSRNLAWAFDAIYKFTPQLQIGFEFRQLNTGYLFSGRKRANHLNLSAAYSF